MRPIDADALKNHAYESCEWSHGGHPLVVEVDDIDDMPTLALDEMRPKLEWISVKKRLPEEWISVLGYMPKAEAFPTVRECYLTNVAFYCPALRMDVRVTHWAEMPEPPKEEA